MQGGPMSLLAAFIYIFLTSTLSGALGMAGGAILLAILMIFLPLPAALVLHGIVSASSCGFRSLINYKNIRYDIVIPFVIGTSIAFVFFYFVPVRLSKQTIFLFIGLLPFLSFLKKFASALDIEKRGRGVFSGIVVGSSQAISGIAGSLLDFFYLSSNLSRFDIVATKALTQTIAHIFKTYFFIQVYQFDFSFFSQEMYFVAIITPLFGSLCGKQILRKFTESTFLKVAKVTMFSFSGLMLYKGVALALPM